MALVTADADTFGKHFNRTPFHIQHALVGHPLLELPALAALSSRLAPKMVEWNSGGGAYGKDHDATLPRLSCAQTILEVANQPAWVLLRNVQDDPVYGKFLDEILDDIKAFSDPIVPGMCQRQGFLFVSSQSAVTPFHFDPEYNFLLQARGNKTVHMWDPSNRNVLPASALDDFYGNEGANRDQPYRDEFLETAWILPLGPGQGLHFPLHAPHWVRTESDVSISFSVTFRSKVSKFREAVHAANGRLRNSIGMNPPEPGRSILWDNAAHFGYRAMRKSRALLARLGGG